MFRSSLAARVTLAALSSAIVTPALANDSSIPAIDVDAIDTNAKVGTYLSFKGAEAAKLMRALPKISGVAGPVVEEHDRGLLVQSPGYNIILTCSDIDWTSSSDSLAFRTPECRITFEKGAYQGDSFPWQPAAKCTPEN
jgi:hypothetical protein